MNNTVLEIENLSKEYYLGEVGTGTLSHDLHRWWARVRGKEDPYSIVGKFIDNTSGNIKPDYIWALKDINFRIQEGDVLGIIGKNGAGKSTLLKIISRITAPTNGAIRAKGRIASLLEVGTGMHPELTGRENIYLNGAILGMKQHEITARYDEIVEFSGCELFVDTPVKRYSTGMRVRLGFSVAAFLDAEILIVDEVLAVGDLQFQRKCLGRMENINREGRTIIFVSHNMGAIQQLCTKAVLLEDGNLVAEGECESVVEKYITSVSGDLDPSREYERNIRNKIAQIRKVSVTDGKNVNGHIDLKDDFIIDIEYELYKNISGVNVGMQILKVTGGEAILSFPDTELDISRLGERKQAKYRAKLRIPGNLLNTAKYIVKVGISDKYHIYDVVQDTTFEVIDNVGIVNHLGHSRKNSVLSTQIPWDVELIQSI